MNRVFVFSAAFLVTFGITVPVGIVTAYAVSFRDRLELLQAAIEHDLSGPPGMEACSVDRAGESTPASPGPRRLDARCTAFYARDLEAGVTLRDEDIAWLRYPAWYVPGAVPSGSVEGRALTHRVFAGEMVRNERLR